ncbi:hypothetical protein ABV23_RS00350 [Escherichia coli]|nr:hypothetical protein [Escherichia coli]
MKVLSSTEYQSALFSLLNTLRKNNELYPSPENDVVNGDVFLLKFVGTNKQDIFTDRYINALRNLVAYKTRQTKREWKRQCDPE